MTKYVSIILSGRPVSGKSSLAKELSSRTGWVVFSPGKLWRDEWRRLYPDGKVSFEEYWRGTSAGQNLAMNKKVAEVVKKGGVIGDLRYAREVSEDSGILKVFLDVSLENRARRAMNRPEYSGLKPERVRDILNEREEDEKRMGRQLYGNDYDYSDPNLFDIVIDANELSIAEEADAIMGILNG